MTGRPARSLLASSAGLLFSSNPGAMAPPISPASRGSLSLRLQLKGGIEGRHRQTAAASCRYGHSRRGGANDVNGHNGIAVPVFAGAFRKVIDDDLFLHRESHTTVPEGVRHSGWGAAFLPQKHPSGDPGDKFPLAELLPGAHCKDGLHGQNDSAERTGWTCWELQTSPV